MADNMEPLGAIIGRVEQAHSRRLRVRSGLEDLLSCDARDWQPPCSACKKPQGMIEHSHNGETAVIDCPLREDAHRCRLAQVDVERQREARIRWLIERSVPRAYQDMQLDEVAPAIRAAIAGYLERMAAHVQAGKGLLVLGTVGAGKSAVLGLIAARAHELQIDCQWIYSYDLYASICRRDEMVREYRRCRLLLVDDFGAAYPAQFPAAEFEGLCEYRQANNLATCITSNLSAADLRAMPDWTRVVDRWRAICWTLTIKGPSRRKPLEGVP